MNGALEQTQALASMHISLEQIDTHAQMSIKTIEQIGDAHTRGQQEEITQERGRWSIQDGAALQVAGWGTGQREAAD